MHSKESINFSAPERKRKSLGTCVKYGNYIKGHLQGKWTREQVIYS